MRRRRRLLRWTMWGLAACALLLAGLYAYLTQPARMHARVLAALHAASIKNVRISHVSFSLWDGLQLVDVAFSPQHKSPFYQPLAPADGPPLVRLAQIDIRCNTFALLFGRLHPTRITVRGAALTFVCAPGGEEQPWGTPGGGPDTWYDDVLRAALARRLPELRLEQTDVHLLRLENSKPHVLQRWLVAGRGNETEHGYRVRFDALGRGEGALAEWEWDARTGAVSGSVDASDLLAIIPLLPPRWAALANQWRLQARARVEHVEFQTTAVQPGGAAPDQPRPRPGLTALRLRLDDVQFAPPIEEEPDSAALRPPRTPRFLNFADTTVAVDYAAARGADAGRLTFRSTGRLNGAPAALTLDAQPRLLERLLERLRAGTATSDFPELVPADDLLAGTLHVDALDLPTARSAPRFVDSHCLSSALRAFFKDYDPHGRVNLRIALAPVADGARALDERLEARIEALGDTLRYFRFPYDFADVRGVVRLADGRVYLENLHGSHGGGRVRAAGLLTNTHEWAGLDVQIHGTSMALDRDLYAALPPEYQQLWQTASPTGVADVLTLLRRPEGTRETGEQPAHVRVAAQLLAGDLTLDGPRRLHQTDGSIVVDNGVLTIHDLYGYDADGAAIRLAGTLAPSAASARADLRVDVADLPVHRDITVPAGPPDSQIHFNGRADLWGRVAGDVSQGAPDALFAVHVKSGLLRGFDPQHTWSDNSGWITARGAAQNLLSFTARDGDAWFRASGVLPDDAAGAPLRFDASAGAAAIDELLRQFVPPAWSSTTTALGLAGAGELSMQLSSGATGASPRADVTLQAATLRPRFLPLPLRDLAAQVRIEGERYEVHEARLAYGERGTIELTGTGGWRGENDWFDLAVTGRDILLSPEFSEALPGALRKVIGRMSPRGTAQILLDRLQHDAGAAPDWIVSGRIQLSQAALDLGVELRDFSGEIAAEARLWPAGGAELEGTFEIERGTISGRPAERWEGQLHKRRGQRWLELDDLRGRLCDGEALGTMRIDPDTLEYELTMTLQQVGLEGLLPARPSGEPTPRQGRVDGNLFLRGRADNDASRRGGGEVRVTGASFLQSPVLKGVAQERERTSKAVSDTVAQAELRFTWEGDELRLTRVDIQSRDLRLVGEGTWNLRDRTVRLTLVGAHPTTWPRIAVLTDVLESAGQDLVQYRVEGPAARPTVTAEPLHKLTEALRQILRQNEPTGKKSY